jgi:oligoendopeptidase F
MQSMKTLWWIVFQGKKTFSQKCLIKMPDLRWADLEPQYNTLLAQTLSIERLPAWLRRWSDLQKLTWEQRAGLKRDRSRDITDPTARRAYQQFIETVFTPFKAANAALAQKLLAFAGEDLPARFHPMLRQMRNEAALFRPENLPLAAQISALEGEVSALAGSIAVTEAGRALSPAELDARLGSPDRSTRAAAFRAHGRAWLERRAEIDDFFLKLLALRRQLAANAGLPDYRAYRWQELGRLDYTPAESLALHEAIAQFVVPLAGQWFAERRARLQAPALRPWDLDFDPGAPPPGDPFPDLPSFEAGMAGVFTRLDPELGALFERLRAGFLDLGRREGKLSGSEEWLFPRTGLPYIRLDAGGTPEGVTLLLHEMGHAFHDYLVISHHDLFWALDYPNEFSEFAAISLTWLAEPFLSTERGGFYTPEQASARRRRALAEIVMRWLPFIALVDSFQHWLYTEALPEIQPADLDAQWRELNRRFRPWIDWSGLEEHLGAGWQREGILFTSPFYMIEYALAHLGALQVWRSAGKDHAAAWAAYRQALSLGNALPLPALFAAAGAKLPFDPGLVRFLIDEIAK